MNKQTTGTILKSLRESKGYSQLQVSKMLNIERTTYVKYETGVINPTRKLKEIAELYGVSTDYLLGLPENEPVRLLPVEMSVDANTSLIDKKLYSVFADRIGEIVSAIIRSRDVDKIEATLDVLEKISKMDKEN